MKLCKLLCRQRRAEVRVTLPDDADGCSAQSVRVAAVARPAAAAGYQGLSALLAVGLGQSEHLTPTQPHQCRGFCYFDPARRQILQHAHPVDLRPAHRNHRHRPKTPQPKPWRVTSLSGPKMTSLSGVYTALSQIHCYGMSMSALRQKATLPRSLLFDRKADLTPAVGSVADAAVFCTRLEKRHTRIRWEEI